MLTHFCIIRADLPLGVLAVQLIHAAGESSGQVPSGTYAVALAARNETHLKLIEEKLQEHGIPHAAVREPDAPWNGALMAIGIEPTADRSSVHPITKRLKLLR